jgi:hypothetical protein
MYTVCLEIHKCGHRKYIKSRKKDLEKIKEKLRLGRYVFFFEITDLTAQVRVN